jgi:hypothetical protein
MGWVEYRYRDRDAMQAALAENLRAHIDEALAQRGRAWLALAGGATEALQRAQASHDALRTLDLGLVACGGSSPAPALESCMSLHPVVERVTARIIERSSATRADYLARMDAARERRPGAQQAFLRQPRAWLRALRAATSRCCASGRGGNIAIVTAYNDMLSAHQPLRALPAR